MSDQGQGTSGACSTLTFRSRSGRAKLCRDRKMYLWWLRCGLQVYGVSRRLSSLARRFGTPISTRFKLTFLCGHACSRVHVEFLSASLHRPHSHARSHALTLLTTPFCCNTSIFHKAYKCHLLPGWPCLLLIGSTHTSPRRTSLSQKVVIIPSWLA